ncbi:uncharacterized protein [Pseudorasbora parva]|uniref:uncharacterized protein n=1 Tax=Pseudorasbora parva TaxID=51549 RepID=UPI00351EDDBE
MEDFIRGILAHLDSKTLETIVEDLSSMGVREIDDLMYIKEEDIRHLMSIVDCRKILQKFSNRDIRGQQNNLLRESAASDMITLNLTPVSSLEASSSTLFTLPPQHSTPVQHSTWPSTFQVPWDKTRSSLRTCLELKKRPDETDRRHMVRVTVDAMREICLNPTLNQCASVAMSIIAQYPDCFEDRTDEGDRMGSGHFTLCSQFKTRLDNLNRNNTLARLRKPKRTAVTEENSLPVQSRAKCAKTDSYGCINWQPSELPEGETRHSLSEKKEELKRTFNQEGQKGADKARVNDLMMITYEAQRRAINISPAPSIDQLKTDWPFLFTKRFLVQHFCSLTGIDLDSRLRESISGKGRRVLHFFRSQLMRWRKEVRTVLADTERVAEDVDPGLAAILVMMAFFKEKEDSLFLLADVTTTQADAETQLSLPSTPRIILLGESVLVPKKWMLALEGKVVMESSDHQLDFTSALAVLFGSFYVFNIEYQEEAASTLEFIQRFLVRINPENSKCTSQFQVSRKSGKVVRRKTMALNPHIASFIRDFAEYDWQNY